MKKLFALNKFRWLIVLALSAVVGCSGGGAIPENVSNNPPPVTGQPKGAVPRLAVRGSNIIEPSGQAITLRGFSWGHWNEFQPQDAAENAAQGANVVRIPLRWWGKYRTPDIDSRDDNASSTAGISQANLQILDDAIRSASAAKLWVVLFIDSDCGQNGTQPSNLSYCDPDGQFGENGHNFWTDPAMRAKFIDVWRFIANRYSETPYIGMFEPLPEINPQNVPDAEIKAFYAEVMSNIREVAPGIPFLIGGRHYKAKAKAIDHVFDPLWKDVIYTGNLFLHDKDLEGDGQKLESFRGRVKELIDFRNRHQVPVFVQQTGVRTKDDPDMKAVKEMMKVVIENKLGFAWWSYRGAKAKNSFEVVYEKGGEWVFKQDLLNALSGAFKQR